MVYIVPTATNCTFPFYKKVQFVTALGIIENMMQKIPLVIGIAGGSGSGKTTVVQEILKRVGDERIAYLQHDSYYKDLTGLPPVQRAEINFDHPDSLETELLIH
jgi:uridine kinase